MGCGCKELGSIQKVDAKEAARAEFERQAREVVEQVKDYPERMRRSVLEAEIARFEEPRYRLVNSVAIDILRAAL